MMRWPILTAFLWSVAQTCCPNLCSGHGSCNNNCQCQCRKGFIGGDCSLYICPYGTAWTDEAVAIDVAHKRAECSNMGACDRESGQCVCFDGWTGAACERNLCEVDCNGHGKCMSMQQYAAVKDPGRDAKRIDALYETRYRTPPATDPYLHYAGITPTNVFTYSDVWDRDMIHGCVCDRGYAGPDCMLRLCPTGDDPLTGTVEDAQGVQYDEKQEVLCKGTAGFFTLSFRKMTTEPIYHDDRVDVMTAKVNALESTGGVVISYSGITTTACTSLGNIISISFPQDFGDVPLLVPDGTHLEHGTFPIELPRLEVTEVRTGDKEDAFCSNRGVCDTSTGICTCSDDFDTSDGKGNKGNALHNRGDCGHATASITKCPGEISCSAHGACQGPPTYRCVCQSGWIGGDCSEKACKYHAAWFDEPIADGEAHQPAECSNRGTCDRTKGECACLEQYEGDACEYIKCPGSPACTGHGQCLDMMGLARAAEFNGDATEFTYGAVPRKRETWDNSKMRGCLCDAGYEGYDCSIVSCPRGDDPKLVSGTFEKVSLTCTGVAPDLIADPTATTPGFAIKFRQRVTASIPFESTEAQVKAALELLSSIGTVNVEFTKKTAAVKAATDAGASAEDLATATAAADKACTADGSNSVLITFTSEMGNLPDVEAILDGVSSVVVDTDGRGLSTKGTKQNAECSGRGLCAYAVGVCKCFEGFTSSDGDGNEGERNDCGFIETQYLGSAAELHNTS